VASAVEASGAAAVVTETAATGVLDVIIDALPYVFLAHNK